MFIDVLPVKRVEIGRGTEVYKLLEVPLDFDCKRNSNF